MSILTQINKVAQAVIVNGLVTGNPVQNPDNLLNTTDSTAIFGATSDVIIGNFPFSIPSNAVIVGISGILRARLNDSSIPPGSVTPVLVDSSSGSNQYFPGAAVVGLSAVLQNYAIGGAYDIWGNVSWTPDKINNLKLQLVGNSALEVAWASMTVFYYIPQTSLIPPPFTLPGCPDCDSTIQALPFQLAQPWLVGQTKLYVTSFNLPNANNDPITLEMIGACGGTINLTVDPDLSPEDGGDFIENFNLDSSLATITPQDGGIFELDIGDIEQRALDFITPYGYNADNQSAHAVGAVVIITNNGPWNGKILKRCHIGTLVGAPLEVQDESDTVAVAVEILNFIGDEVQAEQDPGNPRKANVTVNSNPSNNQPTVENTATGTNDTTPSPTLTVPLTITSANYLRVAVITENETITSVDYDGVAMTPIGETVNAGSNLKVALFGLINPTVGANNVVVTMATARIITTIATGWLDVDTANPTDGISAGNIGTSNQPTDTATTTTDNTVVQDVVGTTNNPTTFAQFGLWSIQGAVTTGNRPGASSSRKVLAPQTVTDTYGLSLSTAWAILLAGIRGITSTPPGSGITSINGDTTPAQILDNTDTLINITQPIAGTKRFTLNVVNLANNNTFINALTSNVNFQNAVNTFVSGSGTIQIDQTPLGGSSTFGLLAGAIDGSNTLFTVSLDVYASGKLEVYKNGVLLQQGSGKDWVETSPSTGTFTLSIAPVTGDIITVVYGGATASGLGAWSSPITEGTPYQAPTDGFVTVYGQASAGLLVILVKTDSSSTPTTIRQQLNLPGNSNAQSVMCPVRKGDYVLVSVTGGGTVSSTIYWIPLG